MADAPDNRSSTKGTNLLSSARDTTSSDKSSPSKKVVVLILGRSGAGISSAVKAMQDTGFFVIDNLPLNMVEVTIASLEKRQTPPIGGYAIGIHVHSQPDETMLEKVKKELSDQFELDVLFLKADPAVLVKRFSTSRRPHPLRDLGGNLMGAIELESKLLSALELKADLVLNTSELNPHVLARYLEARYLGYTPQRKLLVSLISFGFKHEEMAQYDLCFDVRFLRNPFFVDKLSSQTGLNDQVADYVRGDQRYADFLTKTTDLISFLLPHYFGEGKTYLRIGIGCTGGKHRSVTFVRDLFDHYSRQSLSYIHLSTEHRNISH